jgi:23S rRNA (pseudouridine1915-N3)-methyltransferase
MSYPTPNMHILAIGRYRDVAMNALCAEYCKRLGDAHIKLHTLDTPTQSTALQQQTIDTKNLLQQRNKLAATLSGGLKTVVLDPQGQELTSPALATKFGTWLDAGAVNWCFLIGGADGFTPNIQTHADFFWRMGQLTWPHQLARVMLLEQLYRSMSILKGHPYHRE